MATETANAISPEPVKRQIDAVMRQRFVRRTTVNITEYILILVMMGELLVMAPMPAK